MKRFIALLITIQLCLCCLSCAKPEQHAQIVATTLPVYDLTTQLCKSTGLTVSRLITDDISCLHDYTLNPAQMKLAESAELLVISGAGFESFLHDVTTSADTVADASTDIPLHCAEHDHDDTHDHEYDPHIWLSPENGMLMANNIYNALCNTFPERRKQLDENLLQLQSEFDALKKHAESELQALSCNEIITFHDGFSYMAESFHLQILHSIEEESGSEASVSDLITVCDLVTTHNIPAIFVEKNGSHRAARIIARETGAKVYELDTGLSGDSYFDALYHNIDTLKEALG